MFNYVINTFILTVAWQPLANMFVEASGGTSATADVFVTHGLPADNDIVLTEPQLIRLIRAVWVREYCS